MHGRDYWFVTKEEFARMIEADELIEYAIVYGDYKGIPKQQVRDALASGKDVILRIDVQGAETIRKLAPEALLIFLTTESEEELVRRLEDAQDRNCRGDSNCALPRHARNSSASKPSTTSSSTTTFILTKPWTASAPSSTRNIIA